MRHVTIEFKHDEQIQFKHDEQIQFKDDKEIQLFPFYKEPDITYVASVEFNIHKFNIEFADFEEENGNILWAGLYTTKQNSNNVLIASVQGKLTKNECVEYLAKFVFNKIMELKE